MVLLGDYYHKCKQTVSETWFKRQQPSPCSDVKIHDHSRSGNAKGVKTFRTAGTSGQFIFCMTVDG